MHRRDGSSEAALCFQDALRGNHGATTEPRGYDGSERGRPKSPFYAFQHTQVKSCFYTRPGLSALVTLVVFVPVMAYALLTCDDAACARGHLVCDDKTIASFDEGLWMALIPCPKGPYDRQASDPDEA